MNSHSALKDAQSWNETEINYIIFYDLCINENGHFLVVINFSNFTTIVARLVGVH